ncbi:MAG: phosphate starvation protein PhoH [Methyloligella sp.]|nr:MAG: phosphate starvation protein PhoH [Methyloligella sp.]
MGANTKSGSDKKAKKTSSHSQSISFEDNRLLAILLGEFDGNLAIIEDRLNIDAYIHGNILTLEGSKEQCDMAQEILEHLYSRITTGADLTPGDIDGAIRHAESSELREEVEMASDQKTNKKAKSVSKSKYEPLDEALQKEHGKKTKNSESKGKKKFSENGKTQNGQSQNGQAHIRTRKKHITARTPRQSEYIRGMEQSDLVFAFGPAGTGKTYIAVAAAAAALEQGKVERIILSRPAVEAGERLGFLPGDMREKVDPYLRPLYDALYDCLPAERVEKEIENNVIEIAPLAFMRGRTLANSFVILDEAQNCTTMQMKMFLTRLGEGSKMVITGDPSQVDLPRGEKSGLMDASYLLRKVDEIKQITFKGEDVVRRDLVAKIVAAYDEEE